MGRRRAPDLEPAPLGHPVVHRLGGQFPAAAGSPATWPRSSSAAPRPETAPAISQPAIGALWEHRDVPLREKTPWRLLYESAARAQSVLSLNIEDLDLPGKRGKITTKGGVIRWVHWQSGTARLLPRLIAGRPSGPLFLAHSTARPRPHASICRHLSADRACPAALRAGRVPFQAGHRRLHAPPAAPLSLLCFRVAIAATGGQADLRPALFDYLLLAAACHGTT